MWSILERASAAFGAALLLPISAAVAVLIFLDDGLPVLFLQERVGINGRRFRIWKFRTMRVNCGGRPITTANDPRITRSGRWLRKLKLDELPQIVNVVKGDMGVVGPRPELPEFVDLKDPVWQEVLAVKPGITDPATLIFRDEQEMIPASKDTLGYYRDTVLPQKLCLNRQYIRSRSAWRDLKLILLTIRYSFLPGRLDRGRFERAFALGPTK